MPTQSFTALRQQPILYFPNPVTAIVAGTVVTYGFILGNTQNNFAFRYLGRLAIAYVNVDVPLPSSQLFLFHVDTVYMAGFVKTVVVPTSFNGHLGLIFYPADAMDEKALTLVI